MDFRNRLLGCFPSLCDLPAPRLDALLDAAPVARPPAGAILFSENEPCRGFPLLLAGSVRVVKHAPNGREILLYRMEPGDGCVLSGSCLLGSSDYSAVGVAEAGVELLLMPGGLFNALLLEHEPFRHFVFGLYGQRLAEISALVEEVAFRRLDERLAQLLVRQGPLVETTHQRIADELGSVREIVSRLLRSFAERGWVALERERIRVLDPKSLSEMSYPGSGT